MLRREDWFVRPITHAQAKDFISTFHYARGMSRTSVAQFGLFSKHAPDWLAAAAVFLPTTEPAARFVAGDRWREVVALTRMAAFPMLGRNACSMLLAGAVKALKAEGRWIAVLTYADEGVGHTGLVYKAAGWTPAGYAAARGRWIDPATGRQVSVKSTVNRSFQQMRELGYVQMPAARKPRFVKWLR